MGDYTVKKRMEAYRQRREASGWKVVQVTVPEERVDEIKQIAAAMREEDKEVPVSSENE